MGRLCVIKGESIDKEAPNEAWKAIKALRVEGEEDDKVFEGIIRDLEARDRSEKVMETVSYIQIP